MSLPIELLSLTMVKGYQYRYTRSMISTSQK